jgi:glycerophosphoryl diester phosphodiesterase
MPRFILILALLGAAARLPGADQPVFDLQAHRGGKALDPPGNILPAFRKAMDLGVTTLELDTYITREGEIIIIHDPGVLEKAVKKPPQTHGYRIRSHTLGEIKQYVIATRDGKTTTIPTLEEFFLLLKNYPGKAATAPTVLKRAKRIRLNIETKEEGYEHRLVALIRRHGLEKRTTIQSFKMASIVKVKHLSKLIRTSALTQSIEEAVAAQADYWSPEYKELDAARVRKAHALGMKVIPWTCNSRKDMARLIGFGVDGIITDNPATLIELLQQAGRRF